MKNNSKNDLKLVGIIIFSFVIGGIVTLSLLKFTPILNEIIGSSNSTVITKNGTQIYEKSSLAPSVEKIYDAVVVVEGFVREQIASTGTGFVYKVDDNYGYLLTNHHVIEDMEKITVTMSNDKEVEATVLGSDQYLDLAVLQIEKSNVSLIATIGSSEQMNLGDTIFTVGSPMGYDYRGSVTSGILSGKDRMVSVAVTSSNNDWIMRVLQMDASINPGNSGGPLLNANGEVIGICSLKLVDDEIEGMGFAIPIEYAMSHAETLEKGQDINWPVLGISMIGITDYSTLRQYGISLDKSIEEGTVVLEVSRGSSAEEAGIQKGDVIIKVNGHKTKDNAYLRYELYQHQAGDTIEITLLRGTKEITVKVTLGSN